MASDDPVARELLKTGATYQMTHALAVFACALVEWLGGRRARLAPGLFLAGAVFFSGSLYALALGAPRLVGAVTPIGGLLFLLGWAVLAWGTLEIDRAKSDPRLLT